MIMNSKIQFIFIIYFTTSNRQIYIADNNFLKHVKYLIYLPFISLAKKSATDINKLASLLDTIIKVFI